VSFVLDGDRSVTLGFSREFETVVREPIQLIASSLTMAQDIEYSKKYQDDKYEYRHVILPKEVAKKIPEPLKLLSEHEWRSLGVQQSLGWVHYEIHRPEPHILLFRRPVGTDPKTGSAAAAITNTSNIVVAGNNNAKENVNPANAAAIAAAGGNAALGKQQQQKKKLSM